MPHYTAANSTLREYDHYSTPGSVWRSVAHLIPAGTIWDPFYLDGHSGRVWVELGREAIHEPGDFYQMPPRGDVVVTNPPFSDAKRILRRLKENGQPFIVILPLFKVLTRYVRELFSDGGLQLVFPEKRIHYTRCDAQGDACEVQGKASFDTVFFCFGIGLPRDLNWL